MNLIPAKYSGYGKFKSVNSERMRCVLYSVLKPDTFVKRG